MPFLDILKNLVDPVEGVEAATIMGVDGISVQQYPVEGSSCDMESVGVEYGGAIEEIKKASRLLNLGELEEVAVSTLGSAVILRMITQEYFIAMVVGSGANMGRARYHLRRAAVKAREEL
jgi:predicted regulator of Ras-like GTPase activity (Roadblock/LC7/MglB family)